MEDIKVIKEKENPLFKRKEVQIQVNADVTPNYADARKVILEKFSTSEENIRIKKILGSFGSRNFTILANIYESEKDKIDVEGKSKKDVSKQETKSAQESEQENSESITEKFVKESLEESASKTQKESKEEKTE